jgi:Mce-associated membrane protein
VTTEHVKTDDVDVDRDESADVEEPSANDSGQTPAETGEKTGDHARADGARFRRARRVISRWRLITVGLLLVASACAAAGLYFTQYRPDRETDDAAAKAAAAAAAQGTVSLLSYTPDSLDRDLAAAKSHLTGDFLAYYSKFTDQIVAPAAKQKAVKTTASVVRTAVSEPIQTASSVVISLTKINGAWLISAFDPV